MGRLKRGVLTVLFLFTLIQLCLAYPELKTYDITYTYATVQPSPLGITFTVPVSPATIEIYAPEYPVGTEIRLCKATATTPYFNCTESICARWRNGVCIGGYYNNTYAKGYLNDQNRIFLTYSISGSWNFQIVRDQTEAVTGPSPGTEIYRIQKSALPITSTKIDCVSGCDPEKGIVTYTVSSVFAPDTCANHIDQVSGISDKSICSEETPLFGCLDGKAYNLSSFISYCSDKLRKYNLISSCGLNTGVFTTTLDVDKKEITPISKYLSCPTTPQTSYGCFDNSYYKIISTKIGNEDICSCEDKTEKNLVTVCGISEKCDDDKGCVSSSKSEFTITYDEIYLESSPVEISSNVSVTWFISKDGSNEQPVFGEKKQHLSMNLEQGSYVIQATYENNKYGYFIVVKCRNNNDCQSGETCLNPSTISSFCKFKECSSDDECYKKIKSTNTLAYDIKCMDALSMDSYCSYKNYTCTKDVDCISKFPEGTKGIRCVFPSTKDAICEYANCPVSCESNDDCNDNDDSTFDECIFPKTCMAQCTSKALFTLLEPKRTNYMNPPRLDYKIYKPEQCTFNLNGKTEIITRLPMNVKNSIEGNNSFSVDCETVRISSWFLYKYIGEREINYSQLKAQRIDELNQVLSKSKVAQVNKNQERMLGIVTVNSEIKEINGTSEIKTVVNVKENVTDLEVYLKIPKCMAKSIKEMDFDNKDFKVLIDDPLIMWHFKEVTSQENIIYRVKKTVPKDCFDQLKIITAGTQEKETYLWFYVALIPILVLTYVFFSSFAVGQEEEEPEIEAVTNYIRILRKKIARMRGEFSDEKIKEIFLEEGVEEKIIDKALD